MNFSTARRTLAIGVTATLALASCGGDDRVLVGKNSERDATELANANGYGATQDTMAGNPAHGVYLNVEYFEALRKGEWVAPDHCWFPTRVTVNDDLASPGFNGPANDDDRDVGNGVLVGTIDGVYYQYDQSQPAVGTDIVVPTTTPVTTIESPGANELEDSETTTSVDPGNESLPTTSVTDLAIDTEQTTESDHELSPGYGVEHQVVYVVAVVYGHDQVVEMSTTHPAALEVTELDVQPLDGWNVLSIALDAKQEIGDSVDVTLKRIHEDGTTTDETVTVPVGGDELTLLTTDWAFDLDAVDGDCVVPNGSADNTPAAPDTDVLGSPIGDAPELPTPGTPPADPAAAADEALRALRAMYDLTDVYSESKRDVVENPDDWEKMRQKIMENDIVAPYMSQLDPIFRSAVFVSPTEAHILYRLGPSYQWEIGRVLLIDGKWRVASGTVCRDLSAAGYQCPGVVNDPDPGPIG